MGMNRALRLLVLPAAAALLVAFLGLLTMPAHADGGHLRVTGDGIHVDRLAPGMSGSGTFRVSNDSAYDARLDLAATDLVERENGCLRQESRVPTERCDADGGELGAQLEVTVAHDGTPLWSGPLAELARGVTLTDALPAGGTWPLRVQVTLPRSSGNETMTDTTTFGLRFTATGEEGSSQVDAPGVHAGGGGPQAGPPSGSALGPLGQGPRVTLPLTGASITLWVLLLDLAAIAAGLCLLVVSRRRRPVSLLGRHL